MMMDHKAEREAIFLSGIDPITINESEIRDFFAQASRTEPLIRSHYFTVLDKPRKIVEVLLPVNDAILAHQKLNNTRLKNCQVKLIPKNSMKSFIVTNLPAFISEKDLFLMVERISPGLKRVIIADDPEICGKTLGVAVVTYQSYELARNALDLLRNARIMDKQISVTWKDPNYDVIGEITQDTRVIYIKSISLDTTVDRMREILSRFGRIIRIKRFADRAFVEFDDMKNARKALETLKGKRFDGLEWRIYPAKKLDEEKAKETNDKNIVFSKGFLEAEDQEILMKFAFSGVLPEINQVIMNRAAEIVNSAKNFQQIAFENLKTKYEMLSMGQRMPQETSIPVQNAQNIQQNQVQNQGSLSQPKVQAQAPIQMQENVNVNRAQMANNSVKKNEGKELSKTQMKKLKKKEKLEKKKQNQLAKDTTPEKGLGLANNFGNNEAQNMKRSMPPVGANSYDNGLFPSIANQSIQQKQPNGGFGNVGRVSPFGTGGNMGTGQGFMQGFQNKF